MKTDKHSNNIVPFSSDAELNQTSLPNIVLSSAASKQRIEELQKFVQDVMIKGVDYGLVHGFSKPTYWDHAIQKRLRLNNKIHIQSSTRY